MPLTAQGITILMKGGVKMEEKTVIIAHRRRESDYWEGYTERTETETHEWVDYYRSIGQIVKVFPNISKFRANCNKMLDKWDIERKRSKG